MKKIAQDFFKNQHVAIDCLEDFFESDLHFYFEKLYKKKLEISDRGFIKIVRKENQVFLYENIFYDWAQEESSEYINFHGIEIKAGSILNTDAGKQISEKGYFVFENSIQEIERTIKPVLTFLFDSSGCDKSTEPNGMFRFSSDVWGEVKPLEPAHITFEAYSLFKEMENRIERLVSFSNVLRSLDAYDMICLKWSDGRSILPHNDLDIRMFINLVSYWDETYEHRKIKVGEYDWYDYIFQTLLTNQWEGTNNIVTSKKEYNAILSTRYSSPMINVFNPRFYHETTPLKSGSMYSISAHKSFKKIVNNLELVR